MSARLPEKDRVRSQVLTSTQTLATTVAYDDVMDSHVFQDDVTVIGCVLTMGASPLDAHLNADAVVTGYVELTRQATRGQPGTLARVGIYAGWTGILVVGDAAQTIVVMFPVGKGVEIDEGESLNLLATISYIGAGGTMAVTGTAIVLYTER